MRPIVWGLILTVIGAFFWLLISVVFGVVYGFAREEIPPYYMAWIYIFGALMYFSIPITAVIEIYRWWKRRKNLRVVKV